MNKVILIGNVGKEPVCAEKYATFSIATNERVKDGDNYQNKTTWHNVVVFGDAKINLIRNYVHTGNKIMIEGKLIYNEYEKDNIKYTRTEIVALEIELLGSKADATQQVYQQQSNQNTQQGTQEYTIFPQKGVEYDIDGNEIKKKANPQPKPQPQQMQQPQQQEILDSNGNELPF